MPLKPQVIVYVIYFIIPYCVRASPEALLPIPSLFGLDVARGALTLAHANHAVANANMRLDVARMGGVGLDLLAERPHVHPKRGKVAPLAISPHLVEDVVVGEDLPDVVR